MKISTRSRYGLRFLIELAKRNPRKPTLLTEVAASQGISQKYLSKLAIPLIGAGLIRSVRGSKGGYELAKAPEAISLKQVVDCLEGGTKLIPCSNHPSACAKSSSCAAQWAWSGLEAAMRAYMEAVSLADIVEREGPEAFDPGI